MLPHDVTSGAGALRIEFFTCHEPIMERRTLSSGSRPGYLAFEQVLGQQAQ